MHRVVAAHVAAARAVGGGGRSAAALAALVAGVLEALRRVLRLHLCACNQIDAALLAAPAGAQAAAAAPRLSMRGVWEAAQADPPPPPILVLGGHAASLTPY